MSAEREILKYLREAKYNPKLRYKGVHIGFLGLPDFKYYKYQNLANKCSSLKSRGYIKEKYGNYFITYKGEDFLEKPVKNSFDRFTTGKTKNDPKDLLVLYDIPQEETTLRNWFRRQLQKFHFVMIQRSVWVGPSPLPKEFTSYIKSIGMSDKIKTFKLAKGYNVNPQKQ